MKTNEHGKAGKSPVQGGKQGNGRFWDSFPKPAGWAARWDGLELDRELQANRQESASQANEKSEN